MMNTSPRGISMFGAAVLAWMPVANTSLAATAAPCDVRLRVELTPVHVNGLS
jgi:hypothetical protein